MASLRPGMILLQLMLLRGLLYLSLLLACAPGYAQSDSLRGADTSGNRVDSAVLTVAKDSTVVMPIEPVVAELIRFDTMSLQNHPFYSIDAPLQLISSRKQWLGKEFFFYILLVLLLFFAVIKNAFSRYFKDLLKLFFRTTIQHRQVKEQLMQAPLPSLLLNILFFFTGALFLNIVLQHYGLGTSYNFWLLSLYCALGLAAIYLVKFITLKIAGWLFRLQDAIEAYIFIVFATNKIIGIVLLPLVVLLAFTAGDLNEAVLTMSLLLVGGVFVYRFFLSYMSIHRQIKIQLFHFVLYLCAFELIPLLLINKLLFHFLR
ncbi:MAG: DUF4271 domain-containing protein [Chitinophagaceae bacterium]